MKKTISICLLLAILCSLLTQPAMAAETCRITLKSGAQTEYTTGVGGQLQISLDSIFAHSGSDKPKFTLKSGTNDGNKATSPLANGVFYFTSPVAGVYHPVVVASCGSARLEQELTVTVEAGAEGLPVQYSYDETPADSVTVYVTVSSDGIPLRGNDAEQTVLCHLPVTVPYFSLEDYDMMDYSRYHTENGQGSYADDEIVERPTALHLYIYLLERYYLGVPEKDCCIGKYNPLNEDGNQGVLNMYGDACYDDSMSPLNLTGSATSMYMSQFWGHDENLMYFRNHVYPLMSPGWGSTADYILLSDGDTIDVAMFTDWNFYTHGAFACFGSGTSPVNTFTVNAGEPLDFSLLKFSTQSVSDGGDECFEEMEGLNLLVLDENRDVTEIPVTVSPKGTLSCTFPKGGVYYLYGEDPNAGLRTDEDEEWASVAPATAMVIVEGSVRFGDVNGDGKIQANDAALVYSIANGKVAPTQKELKAADVNGDGQILADDAALIYSYANGKISEFPAEEK